MRQLDVYLGESLIGRIVENRKGGRFEYEQSIVGKLAGRPVLSMAFPQKFARSARRKLLLGSMACFPRETAATRFAGALACCRMTGSAFSPR